jgi:hypothetical protein
MKNKFTFVEVLIVLIILGLLASIIIPHFTGKMFRYDMALVSEYLDGLPDQDRGNIQAHKLVLDSFGSYLRSSEGTNYIYLAGPEHIEGYLESRGSDLKRVMGYSDSAVKETLAFERKVLEALLELKEEKKGEKKETAA